jgi:hypothetical protein
VVAYLRELMDIVKSPSPRAEPQRPQVVSQLQRFFGSM